MKFFLVALCILFSAGPACAEVRLKLGMTDAKPIYEASEVLKVAYAKLGIKLTIVPLPARRALMEANSGQSDGDVARMGGLEEQFPNLIPVNIPINTVYGAAFSCDANVKITSVEDLAQYKVGIRNGIRFAEKMTEGQHTVSLDSWDALFDLLFQGQIDAVIAFKGMEKTQHRRTGTDCLHMHLPLLHTHPVYHYLNRRNGNLVPKLEAVLKTMQANGEIQAILSRHQLQ